MTAVLDVNVSTTGAATGAQLLLAAQMLAWRQRPPGKFIAMTLKTASLIGGRALRGTGPTTISARSRT